MLATQRELFEITRDICYLNSASYSPLPLKPFKPAAMRSAARADPGHSTPVLPDASTTARGSLPPG